MRKHDQATPKVIVKHFRTIYSITRGFGQFTYETRGKSSAGMAFHRGDRAYVSSLSLFTAEASRPVTVSRTEKLVII